MQQVTTLRTTRNATTHGVRSSPTAQQAQRCRKTSTADCGGIRVCHQSNLVRQTAAGLCPALVITRLSTQISFWGWPGCYSPMASRFHFLVKNPTMLLFLQGGRRWSTLPRRGTSLTTLPTRFIYVTIRLFFTRFAFLLVSTIASRNLHSRPLLHHRSFPRRSGLSDHTLSVSPLLWTTPLAAGQSIPCVPPG